MTTPAPGDTARGRGSSTVAVASVVSAAAGYGVLLVAARTLSPADNASFLSYWAFLFAVLGVLAGIQNESTRTVGARQGRGLDPDSGVRVLPAALAVGGAVSAVTAALSPWWGPALVGTHWPTTAIALCLGVLAFAGHCALAGAVGGRGRWPTFSVLVASESSARLALVGLVALLGLGAAGLEVASALAAATWLVVVLLSPTARSATAARGDVEPRPFLVNTTKAMAAAAATAVLVVGFPVAVRLTSSEAEYALAAPLLLAISLTRAPLLIPLNAYQGVAIAHFLARRDAPAKPLVRLSAALLGVGVVGAVLAALVGPWLMALLFGPAYAVDGRVIAALTLAATGLAILTMTGAATLATGSHGAYAIGWVVATAVALGGLSLPLPLAWRTVVGLAAGPVVGILVHAVALRRSTATRRHENDDHDR